MIENKTAYREHCKELLARMLAAVDKIDSAADIVQKARLVEEAKQAIKEHEDYTREECETMGIIVNTFSIPQVLWLKEEYPDDIDLVNAYLRGDLDKFKDKKWQK